MASSYKTGQHLSICSLHKGHPHWHNSAGKDHPVSMALQGAFLNESSPAVMQFYSEDRFISSLCSRAKGPWVVLPAPVGCVEEVVWHRGVWCQSTSDWSLKHC